MKRKKIYIVSAITGCFIGVIVFLASINNVKTQRTYDYPFYFDLDGMVQKSNQIVIGKVIADEGVEVLDAGSGLREYCIYRIKVSETIEGDAASGDEIRIRIFKLDDPNDHPFEVGNDYVCFLWDTDGFPAVLLNRSQSQIRLQEDDVLLTEDSYVAVEGTVEKSRSISEINLQKENISNDLYEDILLKDAKQELLTRIRELAAEKD